MPVKVRNLSTNPVVDTKPIPLDGAQQAYQWIGQAMAGQDIEDTEVSLQEELDNCLAELRARQAPYHGGMRNLYSQLETDQLNVYARELQAGYTRLFGSVYESSNEPTPVEPEPVPDSEPIEDRLINEAHLAKRLGAIDVTITGSWVWATFAGKPSEAVRTELKLHKWIWCKNKGKWAFRGKPSRSKKTMSWQYIVDKYGCQSVEDTDGRLMLA